MSFQEFLAGTAILPEQPLRHPENPSERGLNARIHPSGNALILMGDRRVKPPKRISEKYFSRPPRCCRDGTLRAHLRAG